MILYFAGKMFYSRHYMTCNTVFDNFIPGDDNEIVAPVKEQNENVIEHPQNEPNETLTILQQIQNVLLENRPSAGDEIFTDNNFTDTILIVQ